MDKDNRGNIPVTSSKTETVKGAWPALHHPIAEMERAFDRFLGHSWPLDNLFQFEGLRMPSLDVVDRDAEVLVRAEIPGIDKKDINVSLTDGVLTIKGESRREEKGDYYRNEISSASFARSITVPTNVDVTKTVANLKDGILEIKLPKTEISKRQNITVM
jgi:HSP20 family protein